MTNFKLRYQIEADGRQAKAEVREVDGLFNRLGGGLSSAVGGMGGPLGIATAGVTALSAAAVTGAVALFELSKAAADYGSEIFDASKKTGLSAEALSSMKFAADQSGSSLEQVTAGLAKYAKTVGAAADGSEEAAKKLEAFGITPQDAINDLEGSLGRVFQRIQDAPPGIERITLAQKAFGKSGADLLPFIDSFDGDLAGLIKKAKELGVTIDDDAAAAADAFGDQLDTLSAQLAGVGRVIGFEVMPIFMEWASETSEWAVRNKSEIAAWAAGFAGAVRFTASTILNNIDAFAGFGEILLGVANYDWMRVSSGIQRIGTAITAQQGAWDKLTNPNPSGVRDGGGRGVLFIGSDDEDITGTKARRSRRTGRNPADDALREAERAERERVALVKDNLAMQVAEKQASTARLIALEKQRFAEGVINEEQYVRNIRENEMILSSFIIDAKQRELEALKNHDGEVRRLTSDIKILNAGVETQSAEYAENDAKRRSDKAKAEEADHKRRIAHWNEQIKKMQEASDKETEALMKQNRERAESGMATAPGTLAGGIMGSVGTDLVPMFDNATNAMISFQERLMLVKGDINTFVGESIGGMINGLIQMGVAWISTGEFSAKAALQMLAAVAFSIASQAAIKMLFEIAEATAAFARFDFYGGSMHAAAAKMYGTVAIVAGAAGVGLALGARAMGGGSSKSAEKSSSSSSSSSRSEERNTSPISKQNDNTFISGRGSPWQQAAERIADVMDEFQRKVQAVPAGQVFIAGMKQNPGAVGNQVVSDIGRNSNIGVQIQRKTGAR